MTALDIAASKKNHNDFTIKHLVEKGGECDMGTACARRRVQRGRA